MNTRTTAGDNEQQKCVADDEGSDKEGGKGNGNGDKGGGRATATMAKKRAKVVRAMVTMVVGNEEGGDGGNMVRNNNDGLVPVVVHQPVLYSASPSLNDAGDDKSTGQYGSEVDVILPQIGNRSSFSNWLLP